MNSLQILRSALVGGASVLTLTAPASAKIFNIPGGDLNAALDTYMQQAGVEIVYSDDVIRGHKSLGAHGNYTETAALTELLRGTGFTARAMPMSNAIGIVPEAREPKPHAETIRVAAAAAPRASAPMAGAVETVVVTAQKKSENIQNVPIAVTALSQQQLTERQIAGGPDLLRDVPNMNFGKTNFTGYSIELRGIGTQAISVTTDPAVAVALNGTPFIRNHFFEQEFFDLGNVEVLRGPQGTLYGRNATAGVVNLTTAKPTDEYEANLSADIGNFHNRRFEGMLNIPIVGDKLALRIAGEWTKRDGYTINEDTGSPVDGRDLWSGRVTLQWKPSADLNVDLVWEHFQEDDDRMRTAKQLCHTAPVALGQAPTTDVFNGAYYLSQGCDMNTSLYAPSAFEVPNSSALPYACALVGIAAPVSCSVPVYTGVTQSTNLRDIQTAFDPIYRGKNDIVELNADYTFTPELTLTAQTGFNRDFLWSNEDYNRFNTNPGFFVYNAGEPGVISQSGVFCDPQIGCSDRLVAEDLSDETAWQLSQEFRLASNFEGPLNFSFGGNYLHYETKEDYYVFFNSLSAYVATRGAGKYGLPYVPGVSDNTICMKAGLVYPIPNGPHSVGGNDCQYLDPNPITSINGKGHNYFRSYNPYNLNSYALFGETYYEITRDLKFTSGLRWTEDRKHFTDIPSEILVDGWGYPSTGVVDQQWDQFTGRAVLNWTPELSFTDQTTIYESYSHGYKAGGANPPGAVLITSVPVNVYSMISEPDHPLTFKPERVDAFEIGTKNTVLDGKLTLNADAFYYNYHDYQISEIVDRTSINLNFDTHVVGAELESSWEPLPGLRFNGALGLENAQLANGSKAIDLMDRTAGNPNWVVVKPFPTQASNCILPTYLPVQSLVDACGEAYASDLDPVTRSSYVPNPIPGYPGFNPATAPNNGEGFDKDLSHHMLPNAPPVTLALGGQYTLPVASDWAATLRSDFYWQADSWARVFNDNPYDRLRGYTNLNLALILSSNDGWQVMGYVKNVFDTTAITGTFLNSDDSGLTTNVFLTDPRLYGVRITKDFEAGEGNGGYGVPEFLQSLFADDDHGKPPLWIELGGSFDQIDAAQSPYAPPFFAVIEGNGNHFASPIALQAPARSGFEREAKIAFEIPESDWEISASIRYGRTIRSAGSHQQTSPPSPEVLVSSTGGLYIRQTHPALAKRYEDSTNRNRDSYALLDFMAGKDIGLGLFGDERSKLSLGLRAVQFSKTSSASISADPDFAIQYKYAQFGGISIKAPQETWHLYSGQLSINRSFHGLGPRFTWDNSMPVCGEMQSGEVDFDWGLNAAVVFGRQKMHGGHSEAARYETAGMSGYNAAPPITYSHVANLNRAREVVVPNLGGFAGISYRYNNAKVSFGYRADEFFGAMDGGIDTRKSENMGFFGPYANIAIGLGG